MNPFRMLFGPRIDPLARQRVPLPPPELAAKVLAAAHLAAAGAPVHHHWIDRLWESSVARLAWVSIVCGLVLANLSAPRAPELSTEVAVQPSSSGSPSTAPAHDPELADIAALASRLVHPRGHDVERTRQLAVLLDSRGDC